MKLLKLKQRQRRRRVKLSKEPVMSESYYVRVQKDIENVLVFPVGTYYRDGEKRDFDPKNARAMVENFKRNILERDGGKLPVNREHDRAGGRIGWITDIWLTDDGPRARIEPVAGMEDEIASFDYISPEIRWHWQHPYSGKQYNSVLMGAAMTNYPYLLGKTTVHNIWSEKGWDSGLSALSDSALLTLYETVKE